LRQTAEILVIEDDKPTAELLRLVMERGGFKARTAATGLAACRLIGDERPDLILLDIALPDIDGWDLCSIIRTLPDPTLAATPIIMLSARASVEDRLKGLTLGADDYIVKPFSIEEVVLRARKLLAKASKLQACETPGDGSRTYDSVKDMFFHDLKNHMTSMGGFARRIHKEGETAKNERLIKYADCIYRSSQYLQSFAEDLVVFQNIEEGRIDSNLESVDITEVAQTVVALFRPLAEEKNIELREELDSASGAVFFRYSAARICLSNLLENAIKYSPEGSRVTARTRPCGPGKLCVEVQDNGPGVPKEELPRLFDKFYRGATAEKTSNGTGLGLYIVKRLAEDLGATVSVTSTPGAGALFRLTIPSP
jgi:signal transduction histidine kinase